MNSEKLKKETEKYLSELKENILRMDYVSIKRSVEKLRGRILVLQGIKRENEEKKRLGEEYNKEIVNAPVESFYEVLSMMNSIVEVKYPTETIYGKKIDPKILKQRDLMEWYVLLEKGVNHALDSIQ